MSVKSRLSSGTRQQTEVLLILLRVHPYILEGGTYSGKGRWLFGQVPTYCHTQGTICSTMPPDKRRDATSN